MEITGVWCGFVGCPYVLPYECVAKLAGWRSDGDTWYCAAHLTKALRAEAWREFEAQKAENYDHTAE